MLHPDQPARRSFVAECLEDTEGPVVAATDYMRNFAEQIRAFVPQSYVVLGADGFGRSDTRAKLREFFEVDRHYVVIAALSALAADQKVASDTVGDAIKKYGVDPDKPNPRLV